MRAQTISVGSATTSAWISLDTSTTPFNVGFGVTLGTAVLTYKVQHTFDNVQDSTATITAFDHPDVTGKTVNTDGNYAFPIRAIRLNVTAYTSGSAVLTLIQAG